MRNTALERAWNSPPARTNTFNHASLQALPDLARRYLAWAIPDGFAVPSIAHLTMSGEIRVKEWSPFTAVEIIHHSLGFEWSARTRIRGLPVSGADRFSEGRGEMSWKALGLFPLIRASGPDITRSALGRYAGELCWLPTALVGQSVRWSQTTQTTVEPYVTVGNEEVPLSFKINESGAPTGCLILRWGELTPGSFGYRQFRVDFEETGEFDGLRIPTKIRAGWVDNETGSFGETGEFFRATIERAEYR